MDKCALPIKEGGECCENCTVERWGFDKNMKECTEFFYTGCGGNANRFWTKEECMKDCDPSKAGKSHLGYYRH